LSEQDRQTTRRNQLLDALSAAEKEWGDKLETQIEAEATFFKKIIDTRTGAGATTGRLRDRLADLTITKIEEFLTG